LYFKEKFFNIENTGSSVQKEKPQFWISKSKNRHEDILKMNETTFSFYIQVHDPRKTKKLCVTRQDFLTIW